MSKYELETSGGGWRHGAATTLRLCGFLRALEFKTAMEVRFANQYRCAILYYHRIGTGGVPVYNGIPTQVFEAQINYLRKHYRVISLRQFTQEVRNRVIAPPSVVITFDDGYLGTYTEALPILRKYDIPATVYLTVGCIETGDIAWYDKLFLAFELREGDRFEFEFEGHKRSLPLGSRKTRLNSALKLIRELRTVSNKRRVAFSTEFGKKFPLPNSAMTGRMLNWEQVRHMQKNGVSFGGHTMTHPPVSRLATDELKYELAESKEIAEKELGAPILDFAFPFGNMDSCSQASVDFLAATGYETAATTMEGINSFASDLFLLHRTSVIEDGGVSLPMCRLERLFASGASGPLALPPRELVGSESEFAETRRA